MVSAWVKMSSERPRASRQLRTGKRLEVAAHVALGFTYASCHPVEFALSVAVHGEDAVGFADVPTPKDDTFGFIGARPVAHG